MECVIALGRHVIMEKHWPQETADSMRSGYNGVQDRWRWVWSEAEEWKRILEVLLPEMEKFQVRVEETIASYGR